MANEYFLMNLEGFSFLERTYSALVSLPKYILADPYLAIIVPAFSFAKESTFLDCPSHKECVDLYVSIQKIDSS